MSTSIFVIRAKALAACGVVVRRPDEIAARRTVLQQNRKHLFWNASFQNIAVEAATFCVLPNHHFNNNIMPFPSFSIHS